MKFDQFWCNSIKFDIVWLDRDKIEVKFDQILSSLIEFYPIITREKEWKKKKIPSIYRSFGAFRKLKSYFYSVLKVQFLY